MPDGKKPWEKYSSSTPSQKPWEKYSSEVKKKESSQPTSQEDVWGSNSQPKDVYTSLVTEKQIPRQASATSNGKQSSSSGLVGKVNAFDSGLIKPFENYTPVNKNLQLANDAYQYALKNVDYKKSYERYNDEVDQFQFLDGIKDGMKRSYNATIGTALSFVNKKLGGDEDYFKISDYKPLQTEKEEARKQLFQENKTKPTQQEIDQRAKEIFLKNDEQDQMHSLIDGYLPAGYDREGIWKELRLSQLRSNDILREKVASAEVFKNQISEFENYAKTIDKKNPTADQINKYNSLLENAKKASDNLDHLAKNFDNYLNKATDDQQKLELFKYNYDDFQKNLNLLYGGVKNIVGGTTKLIGETDKYVGKRLGGSTAVGEVLSDVGSELLTEGEDLTSPFYRYSATKLNNWADLGSYAAQLTSEQLPILGTIFLGGTPGVAAVSMSSGGQKIKELEDESKKPFGRVYSDGEKLAAGWLYAGAEFIPEQLGTARILKDLERTVSSASSASRRLFNDSLLNNTLKGVGRFSYNTGLEGTTELITTEGQFLVDEELLGIVKSDYEKNQNRAESFLAGSGMGGGMSVVGGALGLGISQAKLYSDTKSIKEVQGLMDQIGKIKAEVESNSTLTDSERTDLYKEMNSLNNKAFDIVSKNANRGINLSVEAKSALLDINQKQKELKDKYNEVYNSNFSKEIKNNKIKELKAEFDYQEQNRNSILEGSYNELTALPREEVVKLKNEASRELMREKIDANPELEGKSIVVSDSEIQQRALENYRNAKQKTGEEVIATETDVDISKKPTTTEITPKEYVEELTKTKQSDPEAFWTVDNVTEEAAQNGTIVNTEDGAALVSKDGDIKGVFKKLGSEAKGVAQDLLAKAVEAGGVKLDNFDGYLTKLYEKAGFRVVSRVPFSEEYGVPEGYSKEKHGTPDVVAMVYDPNGELDIEEKTFDDYDEAMAYRDQYANQVKSDKNLVNLLNEMDQTKGISKKKSIAKNIVDTHLDDIIKSLESKNKLKKIPCK